MSQQSIVLICTGLGHLKRGFEIYIATLGENLNKDKFIKNKIQIWCGGPYQSATTEVHRIANINRTSKFSKMLIMNPLKAIQFEQFTFAISLVPKLILKKPLVLYLGEYQLYCYLYKIRQLLRLKFSLVLYTGGQSIPGLFNPKLDFIHHVTDVYVSACGHLPSKKQFLIPHFVDTHFNFNEDLAQKIRKISAGKKIVLSIGLLDTKIKRMDFLVKSLLPIKEQVFPIFLGEPSKDTSDIEQILLENFGPSGFIMKKVEHSDLATWYRSADIFVLCSPRESFGLAMVEALYFGLPVFCNDHAEAHFVLNKHAHYVNMNDPLTLTNEIQSWLQKNSQGKLSEESKDFVERSYSWTALQNQYHEMFKKIAKQEIGE